MICRADFIPIEKMRFFHDVFGDGEIARVIAESFGITDTISTAITSIHHGDGYPEQLSFHYMPTQFHIEGITPGAVANFEHVTLKVVWALFSFGKGKAFHLGYNKQFNLIFRENRTGR